MLADHLGPGASYPINGEHDAGVLTLSIIEGDPRRKTGKLDAVLVGPGSRAVSAAAAVRWRLLKAEIKAGMEAARDTPAPEAKNGTSRLCCVLAAPLESACYSISLLLRINA